VVSLSIDRLLPSPTVTSIKVDRTDTTPPAHSHTPHTRPVYPLPVHIYLLLGIIYSLPYAHTLYYTRHAVLLLTRHCTPSPSFSPLP